MPLLNQSRTFVIENMKQHQALRELIEEQIELVCVERTKFSTKYVIHEALNNAVEHGNFPIKIVFQNFKCAELTIKITDAGNGFSVQEKINLIRKKGIDQLLEENLYSTRGRGIYMMFRMANEVYYNDQGNEVSFKILNS